MDYSIQSGDNLWNIVKNNYNCSSNREIQETINQIVEENDIEDPNLIYEGTKITLQATDYSIFNEEDEEETAETSTADRAQDFDDWTSSEENYTNALQGEDVDGFQMFDFDASTYSSDLKDFAQEYIDLYDEDGDGLWNLNEFINMSTAGEGISDDYAEEYEDLFTQLFNDLNLDDETDSISAAEFASYLFVSDVDWETFSAADGDLAASLDGNLDYVNYQSFSDPDYTSYETVQEYKQSFYQQYYADN